MVWSVKAKGGQKLTAAFQHMMSGDLISLKEMKSIQWIGQTAHCEKGLWKRYILSPK